jgi:hypothetical protein
MLEKTTRDVVVVAALRPSMEQLAGYLEAARDVLMAGGPARGAARRRTSAARGHALFFDTWRSLVREEGLSEAEAVQLVGRCV